MYAEEVNYWKTSRTSADKWIEKAKAQIASIGGEVLGNAYAAEIGRAAYMIHFSIDGDLFRMTWPVLESKTKNSAAAHIQAATAMFHSVKHQVVSAKFIGAKAAFFPFLQMTDGRVAAELTGIELRRHTPAMLLTEARVTDAEQ